jgi:superfamily II DNA/RNA helicase
MDQKSRTETLDRFRAGKLTFLVASDVAARGLDIPAVSHVLNFDVPTHAEDYIHRIGRTGRAGRSGISITLSAPSDHKYVDAIEKLIQRQIPMVGKPAAEPAANLEPEERREKPSRDGGRRERHRDRHSAPRTPAPRTPAPQREREPELAAAGAPPAPSRKQAPTPARTRSGESPFGNDGPIPAFLLRPGRTV